MRKYKIFLMAFMVLFLLAGAVNASEVEDISDELMIDESSIDLNAEDSILSSDADGTTSEEEILGSIDDDMSSDSEVLSSNEGSEILKSEREFNGTLFYELGNEIYYSNENDTIILKNDLSSTANLLISIYKPVTIDGDGHTLDALNKSGIFNIWSSGVTLKNMILKNTYNAPAVNSQQANVDNITIINCTFIGNTAPRGAAIFSSTDCILESCIFINNRANEFNMGLGGAIYCANNQFSINGCEFYNNSAKDGAAIYCINSTGTIDQFSKFIGNKASNNGGAIYLNSSIESNITSSSFYNNSASLCGGALYSVDSITNMDNAMFFNNTAKMGGAACFENSTSLIENSYMDYNTANANAGALLFNNSNSSIINSYFNYNRAGERGAAIYFANPQNSSECNISSSKFFNNKAKTYKLTVNATKGRLALNLTGWNNYINAIYSESFINFTNVSYWNGETANTDNENDYYYASGQNITLEIYNSQNALLINTTLMTDLMGMQYYDAYDLADGNYKYKAYLANDSYYTNVTSSGSFTLSRKASSTSIQIDDYAEFYYNECNITFDITNRTMARYVITNENGSKVYRNNTLDPYLPITVDLPPSDEYYRITIYNPPNGVYLGSQDSKFFKILKTNSSISISPIEDIQYDEKIRVTTTVTNKNYVNITVYFENKSVAYSVVTDNDTVVLPRLPVGTYNVTATNLETDKIAESSNSITFNVINADNIVSIFATNVTYGDQTLINITAHGDGLYVLEINGTTYNVPVLGSVGRILISLPAGEYFATASFDNENYDTVVTGATFNVSKAENNVTINAYNVFGSSDSIITVTAQADGVYQIEINGTYYDVDVEDGYGEITLSLPAGEYSINAAFGDSNYEISADTPVFNVFEGFGFVTLKNGNLTIEYDSYILDGDDLIVRVSVDNNARGSVEILFADEVYTSDIVDGTAIITIPNVKAGTYVVPVTYSGDENLLGETSYAPFHVKKVSIHMDDVVYGWAKSISYQAKLIDEDGKAISNKEVSFYINGKTIKAYTNKDGLAKISLGLKIGNHNIKLASQYGNVTKKIAIVSRFSGNSNINMYYFDGSKYSFNVYGNDGNPLGAKQVIVIKLNKKSYKVKTDKNGLVSFTIPKTVKPGKYTISVTYKGQTIKNTIKVKKILKTKKLFKVKKRAKKLVLYAKLKKKLKGKKITFKFKGKKYTAKTNSKGVAKVTIKKKVIKKLKKGKKYTVKISYYKTSIKTKVKVR